MVRRWSHRNRSLRAASPTTYPASAGSHGRRVVAAQLGEPFAEQVGRVLRSGLDAVAEQCVECGAVEQRQVGVQIAADLRAVELVDLQPGRLGRRGPFVCPVSDIPNRRIRQAPAGAFHAGCRPVDQPVRSRTSAGSIADAVVRVGVQGVVVGGCGEAGLELGLVHAAAGRTARTLRRGTPRRGAGPVAAARLPPAGAVPPRRCRR